MPLCRDKERMKANTKQITLFYYQSLLLLFLEIGGRHASAKAHEAVDHLASYLSSKEEISQSGI